MKIASKKISYPSKHLGRKVVCEIIAPLDFNPMQSYHLLIMNDGQDFDGLRIKDTLSRMLGLGEIEPVLVVGLYCNENRINEYGTAKQADYKGRGNKAAQHTSFVIEELFPYLKDLWKIDRYKSVAIAGCSLGGLSAMDIGWAYPHLFNKIGAFSPSFWWRSKSYQDGYLDDNDRIMHQLVREGNYDSGLKFWFQAGTHDEKEDRNNNGIIDTIDDIMDIIHELRVKGYQKGLDIAYHEMPGGTHDVPTWSRALPVFLRWAFGGLEKILHSQ